MCDKINIVGVRRILNCKLSRVQGREEAVPIHTLPVSLRQEVALQRDRGNRANDDEFSLP